MSLDSINLPKGVGPDAAKMLDAIQGADDAQALNRAGGKAEGFVLGLESAKAIARCTFVQRASSPWWLGQHSFRSLRFLKAP